MAQNFVVTNLTSSVEASNRKFACDNEEVVYRCVATSMIPNVLFYTQWLWNEELIATFNSFQQLGNSTLNCVSTNDSATPYLHSTLVSTTNNTCVSLMIDIPSLTPSSYVPANRVMIQCEAHGDSELALSNDSLNISSIPMSRKSLIIASCSYIK